MKRYCIPERDAARFVAQMEDVLDAYALPPDPDRPLVCMDEAAKQLLGDAVEPLPMRPGTPKREDYHYTPRNGSWLNVAEVELSVLAEQCLKRRIGDPDTLDAELTAWSTPRNRERCGVKWQFTTADARVKLRRLYPTV